jgi:hypothetical protein
MVRGKFQVTKVARTAYGHPPIYSAVYEISLMPQMTLPEEDQNGIAISGEIRLYIDNPKSAEYLGLGKIFHVEFREVREHREETTGEGKEQNASAFL